MPDAGDTSGTNLCSNKSLTKKNVEQESCTQSSRVRKRKIETKENKKLQHDLICDLYAVQNDQQTEEFARLQDGKLQLHYYTLA